MVKNPGHGNGELTEEIGNGGIIPVLFTIGVVMHENHGCVMAEPDTPENPVGAAFGKRCDIHGKRLCTVQNITYISPDVGIEIGHGPLLTLILNDLSVCHFFIFFDAPDVMPIPPVNQDATDRSRFFPEHPYKHRHHRFNVPGGQTF